MAGRRVANITNDEAAAERRLYKCTEPGCGKLFKRSEHVKRHYRSIHTKEKPFVCPYSECKKRFSRSDNLNQHIRIHRQSSSPLSISSSSSTKEQSKRRRLENN
ncbi:hypothetical protein BDA99DRAFT_440426 [Phascolomyces articulosus]|uniref:C2H2-type domain-containing protein n=1 Tax=Phascolomyces articulosus TaxID=60185 RepID=A0AAD5JX16_9FUNG|nr:hypothetical protein BDA99DRAFT_440426 [Phascolomyces articulosus]